MLILHDYFGVRIERGLSTACLRITYPPTLYDIPFACVGPNTAVILKYLLVPTIDLTDWKHGNARWIDNLRFVWFRVLLQDHDVNSQMEWPISSNQNCARCYVSLSLLFGQFCVNQESRMIKASWIRLFFAMYRLGGLSIIIEIGVRIRERWSERKVTGIVQFSSTKTRQRLWRESNSFPILITICGAAFNKTALQSFESLNFLRNELFTENQISSIRSILLNYAISFLV